MDKILYFDVETTGLNAYRNDIIQIAGIVEIDGEVKETFDIKMQPFRYDNIEEKALQVQNRTIDEIKTYQDPSRGYIEIIQLFDRYVDKFDKSDKFIAVAYNANFDVDFLQQFFRKNGNNFLFSYFGIVIDPLAIVRFLTATKKHSLMLGSHKLGDVCQALGIDISAHDASSDINATRTIFKLLESSISSSFGG